MQFPQMRSLTWSSARACERNIDGEGRVAMGIRPSVRMLAPDAHEAAAGLQGSSATGVRGG